jgi:DNA-directed RNA polymerase sigma subunit (sigma70/sigma32)
VIRAMQHTQENELEVLRSRLFQALENLDQSTLRLLVRRFGLDGNPAMPQEELAKQLGLPIESVIELEAEALRALVGYGKYPPIAKKTSTVEQ